MGKAIRSMGVALALGLLAVIAVVSPPWKSASAEIARTPVFSKVYDPASLIDAAGANTTVTVPGAALGDGCVASFSLDVAGITVNCYVSAASTATVRFQNESTGTLDLASGTLRVFMLPKGTR